MFLFSDSVLRWLNDGVMAVGDFGSTGGRFGWVSGFLSVSLGS